MKFCRVSHVIGIGFVLIRGLRYDEPRLAEAQHFGTSRLNAGFRAEIYERLVFIGSGEQVDRLDQPPSSGRVALKLGCFPSICP